ncbi:MAG: hypothetical protein ACRDHY_09555, partial [Anaerolineales bacterium]
VQVAEAAYGESVRMAAAALAEVAAEGGEARDQAMANVIGAAKAIHTQVLGDVLGRVPEQAQGYIEQAIANSQGGPAEDGPAAQAQPLSFEQRIAGLDTRLTQAQIAIAEGDMASARIELLAFEHEVDARARELAAVAQDDAARGQRLAALLDEALMQHEQALTLLMTQLPAEAAQWVRQALEASQAGRETVVGLFGEGMPGGPPDDLPGGPPEGYGR